MPHDSGALVQQHPFFRGVQWDNLYSSTPPYQPTVDHELDTQNFERFPEQVLAASSTIDPVLRV